MDTEHGDWFDRNERQIWAFVNASLLVAMIMSPLAVRVLMRWM